METILVPVLHVEIPTIKTEDMEAIYAKALKAGGYEGEPTEANVRDMFLDYVDSGYFSNVDIEDVDEISTKEICFWFIRNP